jgi:hypothetical protein
VPASSEHGQLDARNSADRLGADKLGARAHLAQGVGVDVADVAVLGKTVGVVGRAGQQHDLGVDCQVIAAAAAGDAAGAANPVRIGVARVASEGVPDGLRFRRYGT